MTPAPQRKSVKIDGSSATEISRSVEKVIREGKLKPGEALPPVRSLAEELGVSPTTVNAAYRNLRTRGLLVAGGRQGTRVSASPPVLRRLTTTIPPGVMDLASDIPDPTQVPSLAPILESIDGSALGGEAVNHPKVVEIMKAGFTADKVDAARVAVVGTCLTGLERALDAHVRFGDSVVVEDPGPTEVLDLCRTLGLNPIPVRVDSEGPVLASFEEALSKRVQAVIVSSRAQDPTSAAISKKRAAELKKVLAARPEVVVIEYDRVGDAAGVEFHSIRHAKTTSWACIRSFTALHGASLSVAGVAGDGETIGRIEGRLRVGGQWVASMIQHAFVGFHTGGQDFILDAIQDTYQARREALVEALTAVGIEAWGASGNHVWIPVPEEYPVAQSLRDLGWAVMPGERFRMESGPGIRIVTASLPEDKAPKLAEDLQAILG